MSICFLPWVCKWSYYRSLSPKWEFHRKPLFSCSSDTSDGIVPKPNSCCFLSQPKILFSKMRARPYFKLLKLKVVWFCLEGDDHHHVQALSRSLPEVLNSPSPWWRTPICTTLLSWRPSSTLLREENQLKVIEIYFFTVIEDPYLYYPAKFETFFYTSYVECNNPCVRKKHKKLLKITSHGDGGPLSVPPS